MELKDFVRMELDGIEKNLKRVLNGLTQNELMWRPSCGCNSIGLIFFHMARAEDSFTNKHRGKPELWESGKWYKKLNMAENEIGAHYTVEQVNAFPVPKLDDLMAYYTAVRAQTLEYLSSMTSAGFDKKVTVPYWGEIPVAQIFFITVMHTSEHVGEISYLRGLQRGLDK